MAAKSGESRTGLVVFLVLFILLSIGLGVTTYYGYQEADAQKKAAEDAKKQAAQWTTNADYWKVLALTYRSYIGGLPMAAKDDLVTRRKEYDKGTYNAAQDENGKEEHKKTLSVLWGPETAKKWDVAIGKPSSTYQDDLDEWKKKWEAEHKAAVKAAADLAQANELVLSTQREREKHEADCNKKLTELKQEDQRQMTALRDAIAKLEQDRSDRGDKPLKDVAALITENGGLRKERDDLAKKLKEAVATIKKNQDEIARTQPVEDVDVTKIAPENLATVVSISGKGDMPYISIGSADNLKRQVTFSIYGKGVDGRPLRESKGKLEVIRVVGEHRAQARITELRDERRDPVLPGDFIYNPAWNPNLKQHVVIVGVVDLTGDGRDNIQDFIRTLKNQNVVVDAYLDMKTRKLKKPDGDGGGAGEITRATDLLIVGGGPDFGVGAVKAGDARAEEKSETLRAMQAVQDQAEKLGVRVVRLNNYLELSGYALPKTAGVPKEKVGFQRNLDAAGTPVERREQPPK